MESGTCCVLVDFLAVLDCILCEIVSNPTIAEQRLDLIRQRLVALGLDVERISAVAL
jgi:hypothetical protein